MSDENRSIILKIDLFSAAETFYPQPVHLRSATPTGKSGNYLSLKCALMVIGGRTKQSFKCDVMSMGKKPAKLSPSQLLPHPSSDTTPPLQKLSIHAYTGLCLSGWRYNASQRSGERYG